VNALDQLSGQDVKDILELIVILAFVVISRPRPPPPWAPA
jgi:hypothetical protein